MRIYVATKWENMDRAREIMAILTAAGHTITYDWTRQEQESSMQAKADIDGVTSADALVLIVEKEFAYRGALCEFGAALAVNKPVFVLGHALDGRCLFLKHPLVDYTCENHLLSDLSHITPHQV